MNVMVNFKEHGKIRITMNLRLQRAECISTLSCSSNFPIFQHRQIDRRHYNRQTKYLLMKESSSSSDHPQTTTI